MSESALVRRLKAAVKRKYPRAYTVKLADAYHRGLPDLLIVCPTMYGVAHPTYVFVETKTVKGRTNKIQDAEHDKLRRAHAQVMVVRDPQQVLDYLYNQGAVP